MKDDNVIVGVAKAEHTTITSRDEAIAMHLAILANTRTTLKVLSRELDNTIYENAEVLSAIRQLALSKRSRIQILLHDATRVVTRGHRLVDLAQRVQSTISIRVLDARNASYTHDVLLGDCTHGLRLVTDVRYEGTCRLDARAWVRDQASQYDELWEQSSEDPRLRRLHI